MIRIAIVEDDHNYAKTLEKYIQRFEDESKLQLQIERFEDGADIAEDYKGNFDIILMDIEMTFLDGMSAAKKIRAVDEEVVIIFITNMPQFAMQGYEVEALDYVLKPINYYAFSQRLERALSRMKKRTKKFLSLNYKNSIMKLDIDLIYYIEVLDHDLIYHTTTGDISVRGIMREVEEKLKDESFFRSNKAYLINLAYVDGVEESDVLIAGEKLKISRARRREFMDALNDYMNEVSK
ncbi:MAG: LytTR family DNA-binding domain-containing protein [Lachnospiraceae bacterium]|nr:LytTR family DNA-binding domain-containing protein [Lachnospiraceae bacterium]